MKLPSKIKFLALIFSVAMVSACEKDNSDQDNSDDNNNKASIKATLESESRFSMMNEAIELAGKSSVFADANANLTLCAPPNDGFNQILADYNVSSVSELKTALGAELFTRFVMYHALENEVEADKVSDGDYPTMAEPPSRENLTVFISNNGSGKLSLNGGEGRGTYSKNLETIAASNGNIIELDAVVQAQSNYDYVLDTENHYNTSAFVQIMKNTESSFKSLLQDYDAETTVLLLQDAELEAVLAAYFRAILESDDIDALLDASAEAALFAKYNVSTMSELMNSITFEDLKNEGGRSISEIYAEMEVEDNTELMSYLVFEGYEDFSSQNGKDITAKSFTTFTVNATSSSDVQLVDNDGNAIKLGGETAHTASGAVYTVSSVQ